MRVTEQNNFRSHEFNWIKSWFLKTMDKIVRFNILGWVTTSWTYSNSYEQIAFFHINNRNTFRISILVR